MQSTRLSTEIVDSLIATTWTHESSLAAEVYRLVTEPTPSRGAYRVAVLDTPFLRAHVRTGNEMLSRFAAFRTFRVVTTRRLERLFMARVERSSIGLHRVFHRGVANTVADHELAEEPSTGRTGQRIFNRCAEGFLLFFLFLGLPVGPSVGLLAHSASR